LNGRKLVIKSLKRVTIERYVAKIMAVFRTQCSCRLHPNWKSM